MNRNNSFSHILLFILVISGLSGTFHSNTLSKDERKSVVNNLKESKKELLQSVKGLSEAQLNYKSASDKRSVKECMIHLMLAEKGLWDMVEKSLTEPAIPEKNKVIKMTDDQILKEFAVRINKMNTIEPFYPEKAKYNSMEKTISAFKEQRTMMINFMKSSNADFRNHVVKMPFGMLDVYQVSLAISSQSNRHMQLINEVKASSGFPK